MTTTITAMSGADVYDLIYPEYLAKLSMLEQETMCRAVKNSTNLWVGSDDDKIIAVWGLIAPTLLSDRAYLWLYTTDNLAEHVFIFIRHSQRIMAEMLELYPIIVGHGTVGATKSLRWLHWLGAEFSEPQGTLLPFEIRTKQWPQQLERSA